MSRNRTTIYSIALGVLALAAVGCSDDETTNPPAATTTYGTTTSVHGGNVRSFMTVDASGNPTEIGMRISAATVDNGPTTMPNPMDGMHMIELPAGAAAKVAVQDISLDWGPSGHPPAFYSVPHFDMHFYTVPMAERMAWPVTDTAKLNKRPDASLIPANHMTDGTGVPMMGLHYVDVTSPEFDTTSTAGFTSTFIWGYYNGSQVFIEPMITQQFLKGQRTSGTTFEKPIPQPQAYSRTGVYWPTKYTVRWDAATNEHVVSMSGMVKR